MNALLLDCGGFCRNAKPDFFQLLKEMKYQQTSGCVDQKCAAEVGKFVGANIMIIPGITFVKESNTATIVLKLVDVETASIKINFFIVSFLNIYGTTIH